METELIEGLAPLAGHVAVVQNELTSAIAEETEAEALLLARVIEIVGPTALAAVATRPEIAFTICDHAGDTHDESTERATWRGVLLSCAPQAVGPERDCERGNAGTYSGSDLFLLPDGTFRELVYAGTWSKWQGSSWGWTSDERSLSLPEVAAEYQLEKLLGHLRARLESVANGNAPARAKQARTRAARVQALLTLL